METSEYTILDNELQQLNDQIGLVPATMRGCTTMQQNMMMQADPADYDNPDHTQSPCVVLADKNDFEHEVHTYQAEQRGCPAPRKYTAPAEVVDEIVYEVTKYEYWWVAVLLIVILIIKIIRS